MFHSTSRKIIRVLLVPSLALVLAFSAPAADVVSIEGITEPIQDVLLSSPVIGIIGARLVEEGAFVKAGQILVELDKGLEALDVRRKQLVKEMAKTELERLKELSERSAISVSREELEKKRTEFDLAGVDLELAQENLKRRLLAAPFDGYVTEIYLETGESCEPRTPVLRLVDTRQCYFVANIDAQLGHRLKVGQKYPLIAETGGQRVQIEGTVNFVSPVVDPASGLMRVKVLFKNDNGAIRAGVTARLMLNLADHGS